MGEAVFSPELLASGASGDLVVIDFHGTAGEKTVGERLAAEPGTDRNVYQIDPVRDLSVALDGRGEIPDLGEIAAAYGAPLDRVPAGPGPDPGLVVVGICSAGALALRVAACLSRRAKVEVVLIRPSWPDPALIDEIFTDLRAGLQAAPAQSSRAVFEGDSERALEDSLDILRADASALAAARNISPASPLFGQLIARYRGWLGFLLSSREALLSPWTRDLPVRVYAERGASGQVPWFPEGAYTVSHPDGSDDESWLLADLAQART